MAPSLWQKKLFKFTFTVMLIYVLQHWIVEKSAILSDKWKLLNDKCISYTWNTANPSEKLEKMLSSAMALKGLKIMLRVNTDVGFDL